MKFESPIILISTVYNVPLCNTHNQVNVFPVLTAQEDNIIVTTLQTVKITVQCASSKPVSLLQMC